MPTTPPRPVSRAAALPAPSGAERRPYVFRLRQGGRERLYYRRGGRYVALPGPEGSAAFLLAWEAAHAAHAAPLPSGVRSARGTLDAAVELYLLSADFAQLAPKTRANYRHQIDGFRRAFGALRVAALDEAWWEGLRAKYLGRPDDFNRLRSRMREVLRLHRRLHPHEAAPRDPFLEVRRLRVERPEAHLKQNRPWPVAVLGAVLRAATPEFRALLVAYLLTAQRGGDLTTLERGQLEAARGLLFLTQDKTEVSQAFHVGPLLGWALANGGAHPKRLFATPRGRAWTLGNAQTTLARLLRILELPRYTLHGLRATGPTLLRQEGAETALLRALTGHTSDRTLEAYLEGVAAYPLRRQAQERLEEMFGAMVSTAAGEGNARRFAGTTGRAARAPKGRSDK